MEFLLELIKRLFAKTPGFFKVVQILSVITALITGLPLLLANAGIVLPEPLNALTSQAVAIAALVATFVAQLTATTAEKRAKGIGDN